MWDLPEPRIRGSRIYARDCDDIAGVASMLCMLETLSRRRIPAEAYCMFTRAEEVGFAGCLSACRARTLPTKCAVVGIECSSLLAGAQQGAGLEVHVEVGGDGDGFVLSRGVLDDGQRRGGVVIENRDGQFLGPVLQGGAGGVEEPDGEGFVAGLELGVVVDLDVDLGIGRAGGEGDDPAAQDLEIDAVFGGVARGGGDDLVGHGDVVIGGGSTADAQGDGELIGVFVPGGFSVGPTTPG